MYCAGCQRNVCLWRGVCGTINIDSDVHPMRLGSRNLEEMEF